MGWSKLCAVAKAKREEKRRRRGETERLTETSKRRYQVENKATVTEDTPVRVVIFYIAQVRSEEGRESVLVK